MNEVEKWLSDNKLEKEDIVLHNGKPVYLRGFGATILSVGSIKESRDGYIVKPSDLTLIERNFNDFKAPFEGQKVRLKIIPTKSVCGISLSTIDPPESTNEILTYRMKHTGTAPFVLLFKKNGNSCNVPWQFIEIVKESDEVKKPIETGVRRGPKEVVYCKVSDCVFPLRVFDQLKNVKIKYAFDKYFCSESQFGKKINGAWVFLFYKKSENTVIVSNSLKKGAVWNEPCEEICLFSNFINLFEKPKTPDTTKTTSSTTTTNRTVTSSNEIDFFKKVSKPSNVSPLSW